ncbi:MAG: YARHG domain-containing protein [Clostridium sp.]
MWGGLEELDVVSEVTDVIVEYRESIYIERAQRELEKSNFKQAIKEFEKGYENCKTKNTLKSEWERVIESIIKGEKNLSFSKQIEERLTNMVYILNVIERYNLRVDRIIVKETLREIIGLEWIYEVYIGGTEVTIDLNVAIKKINELKVAYYSLWREEEKIEGYFEKFDDEDTTKIKILVNKIMWKNENEERFIDELNLLRSIYTKCKDLEGYLLGRETLRILGCKWEKYENIREKTLINGLHEEYSKGHYISSNIIKNYIENRNCIGVQEIERILNSLENAWEAKRSTLHNGAEAIYTNLVKSRDQIYIEMTFIDKYNLNRTRHKLNVFKWLKNRYMVISNKVFEDLVKYLRDTIVADEKIEFLTMLVERTPNKTRIALNIFNDCMYREEYKFINIINIIETRNIEKGVEKLFNELDKLSFNQENQKYIRKIISLVEEENKEDVLIGILKKYLKEYNRSYHKENKKEIIQLIKKLSKGYKRKIQNFLWIGKYKTIGFLWNRKIEILFFIVICIIASLFAATFYSYHKTKEERIRDKEKSSTSTEYHKSNYSDSTSSRDSSDYSSSNSDDDISDYNYSSSSSSNRSEQSRRNEYGNRNEDDGSITVTDNENKQDEPKLRHLEHIDTDAYTSPRINKPEYNSGSLMFGNSYQEYLTDSDLDGLSEDTLNLLRNEIYAKNGRIYNDEPYKSYFESKSWYHPTRKEIPDSDLNIYEKKNIQLILKHELEEQKENNNY